MRHYTTISQQFTDSAVYEGVLAGRKTYAARLMTKQQCVKRIDYLTIIDGHSLKFTYITLDEEPGDTCLCSEVHFDVDDDYDRLAKGIKIRATKWLLSVWKHLVDQELYGEYYCDPHEGDGDGAYRRQLFGKLGFVEEYGMLVLRTEDGPAS